MQLGLAADCIHYTEHLPGLDLLAGLYGNLRQLAVESEIAAVLHQHALVVAGHHHHLADRSVEHALYRCSGAQGYTYTVVERHLYVLVDGMPVLAEAVHHGAFRRPWQFTYVCRELGVELGVYRLALRPPGCSGSLFHHTPHLPFEGLLLLVLGLQLLLVF